MYRQLALTNDLKNCCLRQFNRFQQNHDQNRFSHNLHILTEKKICERKRFHIKAMFNTPIDTYKEANINQICKNFGHKMKKNCLFFPFSTFEFKIGNYDREHIRGIYHN